MDELQKIQSVIWPLVPCRCGQLLVISGELDCEVCKGTGLILPDEDSAEAALRVVNGLVRLLVNLEGRVARVEHTANECAGTLNANSNKNSEYWDSLLNQNRMLRDELAATIAYVDGRPPPDDGHRHSKRVKESDPIRALTRMARVEIRASVDDVVTPVAVQAHVRQILGHNMQKAVADILGFDSYGGSSSRSSEFRKKLEKIVTPAVDTTLEAMQPQITAIVDEVLSTASVERGSYSDPRNNLRMVVSEETRDTFNRMFRSRVAKLVEDRATELAELVLSEQLDRVVLEEMPWLTKYIAMEKLGSKLGE